MHYYKIQIVLQEVPGEISICFSICGCLIKCEGCHSPFLWKRGNGHLLTEKIFKDAISRYQGLATCVLFMGGEWHEDELVAYLKIAREMHFKTCLYTGEDEVSDRILNELTWIKTGKWMASLGGLDHPLTNQKFIEVSTNKNLNHLFLNSS